ncbi:MAG TPA: hypothetical protein VFF15_02730 [Flavobacteriaceae bacterium]|nr:hypothetical protein [Flavobacteriaceae bacterium]
MKRLPQINRFFTVVCSIIIISITFTSCEQESLYDQIDQNHELLDDASRPLLINNALLFTPELLPYTDCAEVCIDSENELFYSITDSQSRAAGPNSKEVNYVAFNTSNRFFVDATYTITSGNANAKATITIDINGDTRVFDNVPSGNTVRHSIALASDWQACDVVSFSVLQEGLSMPVSFDEEYSLVGICGSCEENFSYRLNLDGSYTFFYTSEEDLDNAEVKFTSPHITGFEALDGKIYSVNPGKRNGAPTVLTWNGDIDACQELTFAIRFDADCEQTNSGFANIFTDFKVNGVSKKGTQENIRLNCFK